MKIKVKGYLKNITNDTINNFSISAIRNKDKISYVLDNDKYILKILSPNQLVLLRENTEIKSIIYFQKNKNLPSLYTLKKKDLTLEINIKTLNIVINDNSINIIYLVNESNEKFEYNIEMSD